MENDKAFLRIFASLAVLLALAGQVYCAGTSSMQVTGYSTVPSSVYPGSTGQIQITLGNSGSDTATAITLYYDDSTIYGNTRGSVSVGDIGAGGTTLASIPFAIPSSHTGGVYLVPINIYYSDSGGKSSKSLPLTLSISVSQRQVLEAKTLSISRNVVQPGDAFTANIQIINDGGTTKNVVIKSPDNSSFTLDGASQQRVGDVPFNGSVTESVVLRASSSAGAGRYMLPLVVEYQDANQNTVSQTIYIGPVSVSDSSIQFDVNMVPAGVTEVGLEAKFKVSVTNRGSTSTSVVLDMNQSSVFTPIGNGRVYIENLEPGETQERTVSLGVSPSASAGYYSFPVLVSANGASYLQSMGVVVYASQELTITTTTQPTSVSPGSSGVTALAQISNIGNSAVRSMYMSVASTNDITVSGTTDKFVGTLNVDDFATFQFTISVPGKTAPGTYKVPIKITFKDTTNAQHTIEKDAVVVVGGSVSASGQAQGASGVSTGAYGTRRNSGILETLGPIGTVIVLAVVAVLGYFGYKRYKAGKAQKKAPEDKGMDRGSAR
ncbi:MAG: hypothetical protein ACP5NX_00205 [Candidatus Bilamarchaeaceae archaeon]